jgi:hypothetical protein
MRERLTAEPRRWQYRTALLSCLPRRAVEIDVLNELGTDGWELVTISPTGVAYLKRPVAMVPASAK